MRCWRGRETVLNRWRLCRPTYVRIYIVLNYYWDFGKIIQPRDCYFIMARAHRAPQQTRKNINIPSPESTHLCVHAQKKTSFFLAISSFPNVIYFLVLPSPPGVSINTTRTRVFPRFRLILAYIIHFARTASEPPPSSVGRSRARRP